MTRQRIRTALHEIAMVAFVQYVMWIFGVTDRFTLIVVGGFASLILWKIYARLAGHKIS